MMPIIYEKDETTFTSNGLGRLQECLTCQVTEERNSVYECEFTYPVGAQNFDLIQPGRIILVTHDDTGDTQPFDIISYSKPIDGIVTFHAVHVSYRQAYMTVSGKNINSLADAFSLLETAQPSNPFTYTASFTSSAYFAGADGVPKTVRSLLGGVEGSVLDTYGGEFTWDRFQVRLDRQRGQYRDFTIRYGVNMLNYTEDVDYSETYTSVIPYWTGSDSSGATTVVKGSRVDSGLTSYTNRNECVPLDLTDKFENKPTAAQLRSEAASILASRQSNLPQQTITVDFVRLQDLGEFDAYDSLLQCRLCDSIQVIFPEYGMNGTYKIVKTVYDVLQERYTEMQLGALSTTLAEALGVSSSSPLQYTGGSGGTVDDLIVNNTLTVGGSVTIGGHPGPIGEFLTGSSTENSVATGGSWKRTGADVSLTAGTWVIMARANFPAATAGGRGVSIGITSSIADSRTYVQAVNSSAVNTNVVGMLIAEVASTTTYKAFISHTAGSSQSGINVSILAVRIK